MLPREGALLHRTNEGVQPGGVGAIGLRLRIKSNKPGVSVRVRVPERVY